MNTLQNKKTKYRTHTCGVLTLKDVGKQVTLSGWVQKARNLGSMSFIDLRDRYGITQITFNNDYNADLCQKSQELGREFVIQIEGKVIERQSKNLNIATGEIEVLADSLRILNKSEVPPFTIEANSDGGDELRMKYRYLDLRRSPLQENLMLRSMMAYKSREYLIKQGFVEVETPFLIGSTPEGARDFIVPSRMNEGQFYALPQSPQLFKQLLMVAGYDRYFQVVKCFRDEDLRADRQPEFTQLDCEMSFVGQEDVLNTFEGLFKYVLKEIKEIDINYDFPSMPWSEAIEKYGSDKPDLRFKMELKDITKLVKGKDFKVFDEVEYVGAICVPNCSEYTRKQLDELTELVKKPQIGAKGLVYIRYNIDGSIKSSIDKYYTQDEMLFWSKQIDAKAGDLILVLCGSKMKTLGQLGTLRLEMGNQLGFMDKNIFRPLWVVDFPLVEWGEEEQRFFAMHHPFTSPKDEDIHLLDTEPAKVRANAYDLVVNGVELGGGSVRIFDKDIQNKMLKIIGFTQEEADKQFGFLMNAFKYGAPPHAGIAFGFDRWVSLIAGLDSIRDTIAFPKNNSGRDMMTGAPYQINPKQLDELKIKIVK